MKKIIASLAVAGALSFSVVPVTFAASHGQGWVDCNTQYAATLRDGSNLSIATNVGDAVSQSSSNISNWIEANRALVACYQSLQ
ncbi:MAG: hypothetical protein L3J32_08620 [Rhizobiaceae bacterium]|nr:hypothetical protein [Rhizobiaceae bacterium]